MTGSSLHRQVENRLRERGVRYTKGRRVVVTTLVAEDGPRSAAELSARLTPGIPLSSLYRTLAVLEEVGVVVPHFATKGIARYELAEWLTGHHHHLGCIECGVVEDIEIPDPYEYQIESLVEKIAAMASFDPTNHALEIEGRCARCA